MAAKAPSTSHLLKKLRSLMQASSAGSLNAYIVPSEDSHQNEYISDCDARRQFISKFSGSAGTAVVTTEKAALWTDGRYHLQASKQLDLDSWTLMKDGLPDTQSQGDWLKDSLTRGSKVGVDPFLISHSSWKRLSKELRSSDIELVPVKENLVDLVWEDTTIHVPGVDSVRPSRPCNKLMSLNITITGKKWETKITELREEMTKKKANSIILTALDDIAWLFNLRGSDIDFNPVFFAYSVITQSDIYIFIDEQKLTLDVQDSLNDLQLAYGLGTIGLSVQFKPYDTVIPFIQSELLEKQSGLIWVTVRSSEAIVSSVPKSRRLMVANPVASKKAIKNEVEVNNIKNAHIKDAAALVEYLAWLENMVEMHPDGHDDLWEISGADYLEKCRAQQPCFMGLSFPSISASGPNGAVIHYHPEETTRRPISKKEMYLIDSGAQYIDGTTDVTRTLHFGEPSEHERQCFTRVLKGHIQLALSVFPKATKGASLDSFARRPLWQDGLDYLHGTGHGVGMFLNVHEGPCSISFRSHPDDTGLEDGMILSNEPGYYEDGAFGIRIENLVVVRKAEPKFNFQDRGYLKLETITLVPIQNKMIDVKMLTNEEIAWLNEYHAQCRSVIGKYLEKTQKGNALKWLIKETEKLCRQ